MGIYPTDPDVVPEGELQWQVAAPVSASVRVQAPYVLSVLPSTESVSLGSSVGDSHHDGLFMKNWVIDNGFVQIAATRMLFHDLDNPNPLAVKTTIVFPVKRNGAAVDAAWPIAAGWPCAVCIPLFARSIRPCCVPTLDCCRG